MIRSNTLRPHGSNDDQALPGHLDDVIRSNTLRPHGSMPLACLAHDVGDVIRSNTLRPHGSTDNGDGTVTDNQSDPQQYAAASLKRCRAVRERHPVARDPQQYAAASLKRFQGSKGIRIVNVIRSNTLRPHGS